MSGSFPRFGIVLAIVGLAAVGAKAGPDDAPLVDVYLDGSGTTVVDEVLRSKAQVVLEDLKTIDEIPAAARRTVLPEAHRLPHRQAVGLLVPEGTQEGSRAWFEADLIRRDDAQIVLTHHDAARQQFVLAGYSSGGPAEDRRPWMVLFTPEFLHAQAEFQVPSSTAEGLTLREVAGLDADRIYFKAESADRGDFLVSARYSVRSAERVSRR